MELQKVPLIVARFEEREWNVIVQESPTLQKAMAEWHKSDGDIRSALEGFNGMLKEVMDEIVDSQRPTKTVKALAAPTSRVTIPPNDTAHKFWCRVPNCPDPGPYKRSQELGIHKRNAHGILGVSTHAKAAAKGKKKSKPGPKPKAAGKGGRPKKTRLVTTIAPVLAPRAVDTIPMREGLSLEPEQYGASSANIVDDLGG